MQVLTAGLRRLEAPGALVRQGGLVRRPQVGRPSEEPWDVLCEHVEHLARRVAARDALGIRREDGKVPIPSLRQLSPLHLIDLGRELRVGGAIGPEEIGPPASSCGAARPDARGEVLANTVGDQELRLLRPAIAPLGKAYPFCTDRLAMGRRRGGLLRAALADGGVEDDEGGAGLRFPADADRLLDAIEV